MEPYVPPSRCKGFISWYDSKNVAGVLSFLKFQQYLLKADCSVINEAEYIVSDEHVPLSVKEIFREHLFRFVRIHESLKVVQEKHHDSSQRP